MAKEEWTQLGVKFCHHVGEDVELMEKRVYPVNMLDGSGEKYRVMARKCSAGFQCTGMDDPCVWVDKDGDGRQYNR